MRKKLGSRLFSAFMVLAMVFLLLVPMSTASANTSTKPFKQNAPSESTLQQKAAIAEQLNVLEGGSKLHKDLQGLSGNKDVAVIIHLSEKPVALEKGISELKGKAFSATQENQVRAKVKAQQISVQKALTINNIAIKKGYAFDTVLNGFAAVVKADDLDKLRAIPGITLVEPDAIVYALEEPQKSKPSKTTMPIKDTIIESKMNTSNSFLGIEKLWNEGIEGQGIKVAVLDTGIDADHPEFAGIYKGGKNFIPNSSTYTRNRADNDASETSPVERPAGTPEFNERGSAFYTSHGTHVAGTIAAIGANEYGIKGIAPKVDLYAYRVLGAYGSGSSSGIVKAIDTAVIEKMDIINLSLGGGENTETDAGSFAINNAMMAGTIGVLATGNDGPNRGTMGTPATARLGIAVGNTTNPETMHNGQVNVTVGDYTLSKKLPIMGTTFGEDLATQLQGEFEIVAVPGNGEAKDYEGLDVKGKVALISRGSIAFVDKIAHAKNNGAAATIIHNFAGGTNAPNISGTFLGDSFAFLPSYDMSQTDGDAIRAALANGTGKVTFGSFDSSRTVGDEVNDSSSRGPSTPNFDIKPDVSAPGTNIMSTIPMYKADFPDAVYNEAYDRKTGTSMATPHIAGIAALVKQANPSWSAFDVKVALSNTAKVLNTAKYDVFAQGAGRVNAYAAAHPSVLAYAVDTAVQNGSGTIVENLKGTVTFGPQSLNENLSVTKQILVKDMKGVGGTYNVTVDKTKSFGDAQVTVDKSSFTLAGEQVLNVTLTASKNTASKAGDEILGYINISGNGTEISLPFAADFGIANTTAITNMAITETDLSFNDDGVKDTAELTFTLTGNVGQNLIELWDIMDPEGGYYGDGYIGAIHGSSSLAKGSWKLNIDGQYQEWGTTVLSTIPDGLYTIDFSAQAGTAIIGDYVGPVVVKTTKPEIAGSVKDGVATGKVTDKYITYNEELYLYGLEYDLNEKLHASYIATQNGVAAAAVSFNLADDGSFSFPITNETDAVKVIITDEAGNVGEAIIYEKEEVEAVVTLSVNPTKVDVTTGKTAQLTVTETTTPKDGTPKVEDVTAKSTYKVADEKIATVKDGLVTGVAKGSTTITVSKGNNEVTVNVTVTDPVVIVPGVKLIAEPAQLKMKPLESTKVTITEVTTKANGEVIEKDVTLLSWYSTSKMSVATAVGGSVTAWKEGTATITAKYKGNTVNIDVIVSKVPEPVVTLVANQTQLDLKTGEEAQLKITEVTTVGDKVTEKDVTNDAEYKVSDTKVASVNKGLVKATEVGTATITAKSGKNEVTVNVTVTKAPEPVVTLVADQTQLELNPLEIRKLTIKEVTTMPDGEVIEKDVSWSAEYSVDDSHIAFAYKGYIIGLLPGKTTLTVKHGEQEVKVKVTTRFKLNIFNPSEVPAKIEEFKKTVDK